MNMTKRIAVALAIATLALVGPGCALFQKDKLEAGGAYSATDVAAAMPELYVADSSFDLAVSGLTTTFNFEQDNRQLLWAITPDIKHSLDRIRIQAGAIKVEYAVARNAYLANPVPANLSTLNTILAKLVAVNSTALTVINQKGKP